MTVRNITRALAVLRTLLRRELVDFRRDSRRMTFVFGAAVIYILMFGALYMPNIVKSVPLVIYDEDNSRMSREISRDFGYSDAFRIIGYVDSEEEMRALIREKEACSAIHIPKNFAKDTLAGTGGTVLFLTNGSHILLTNVASASASNIISHYSRQVAVSRTALATGMNEGMLRIRLAPVTLSLRILNNSTQGYLYFFVIGLALVAFQQGLLFSVGAATASEYEKGRPCRYGSAAILATKVLFYWFCAFAAFGILLILAHVIWDIPVKAPLWCFVVLAAFFALAAVSFGICFCCFFPTELAFARGIIMYPVPAFLLSGYTWPSAAMPLFTQYLSVLFPLRWCSSTVRELLLGGGSPSYGICLVALALLTVLFLGIGYPLFCKRLSACTAA